MEVAAKGQFILRPYVAIVKDYGIYYKGLVGWDTKMYTWKGGRARGVGWIKKRVSW